MRLVSFIRKKQVRLGLLGSGDQVIDFAEVHRRFLKAGEPPYVRDMLALIEAGGKGLTAARRVLKYVEGQKPEGLKRLRHGGVVLNLTRTKLHAPIPQPRKNVVLLGVNYQEHIVEGARARAVELKTPEAPIFFTKPATSVIGHLGKVIHHAATQRLDYEAE